MNFKNEGVPNFIIEILSNNRNSDLVIKKGIFESFGVEEYWIIDPEDEYILKYRIVNEEYKLEKKYSRNDKSILANIINLEISVEDKFE